jgi:hypothetical protein
MFPFIAQVPFPLHTFMWQLAIFNLLYFGQLCLIFNKHEFLTYRLITIISKLLSINRNDFFNNPFSNNQVLKKRFYIKEVVAFYISVHLHADSAAWLIRLREFQQNVQNGREVFFSRPTTNKIWLATRWNK